MWLKVKLLHIRLKFAFIGLTFKLKTFGPPHPHPRPRPRLGLAQTQKVTFCVRRRQRLSGVNTSASLEMMKVTTTATEFRKLHILRVEVRVELWATANIPATTLELCPARMSLTE